MKGAVYADAGGAVGLQGTDVLGATGEVNTPGCIPAQTATPRCRREPVRDCSSTTATSSARSVGVGLIWASPFGPLRFDYAVPLTKGTYDRVQQFKFGGGTSF